MAVRSVAQSQDTSAVATLWTGGIRAGRPVVPSNHPNGMLAGVPRLLPVDPLWPGFAVNTLFYAGVLWMLYCGPFALRRRGRIKRGLCVACAYDLRGSATTSDACPECGEAVTPKTATE